jgi:hypothetical protein
MQPTYLITMAIFQQTSLSRLIGKQADFLSGYSKLINRQQSIQTGGNSAGYDWVASQSMSLSRHHKMAKTILIYAIMHGQLAEFSSKDSMFQA